MYLDDIGDLFSPAPGSHLALSLAAPSPPPGLAAEGAVRAAASNFARTWLEHATSEEVGELLATRPHIPTALDAELLRAVQAEHGSLRDRDRLRRASRDAFWQAIEGPQPTP